MINTKILKLLQDNNIDEAEGVAFLLCIFYGYKKLPFINQDIKTSIKMLNIVSIENDIINFKLPLFENVELIPLENLSNDTIIKRIEEFTKSKYIPLFPTRSETMLSYDISGNTAECVKRMTKFIKDFDKDIKPGFSLEEKFNYIYKATENYLASQRALGWGYTKKNSKFIKDDNGSVLESGIQRILNNELTDLEALFNFHQEMK